MENFSVMLITGSRKGIGRYLAEYYIGKGYQVEGCSRGNSDLDDPKYNHHIVDICDESQVREMIGSIRRRHGRLDITINNAGIASMNLFLLTPEHIASKILNTNLIGTFIVCRESAKLMKKHRYGRIVNLSTIAVPMKLEGEALYAASKNAVTTFSKIIAKELSSFGITCNIVGPAPIETDLIKSIPDGKIDEIIERLAIKRLGKFVDVANVIDFFIKPESDYITGQIIYLGGVS